MIVAAGALQTVVYLRLFASEFLNLDMLFVIVGSLEQIVGRFFVYDIR